MEKKELQKILSHAYNRENWKLVLNQVFGIKNLYVQAKSIANIKDTTNAVQSAVELGSFETEDDRLIGVYELVLKDDSSIKLSRNRVGLRALLRDIYKYDVDGALIVFVQDHKWRFSYVSETRSKETEPKRYTYLLGEGESCRTAADRFYKLQNNPIYLEDLFDAFSVERLNLEFFKTYKEFFESFSNHLYQQEKYRKILLDNPNLLDAGWKSKEAKPIRDFVKKLLGRIVFLQFLQKKGWMGVAIDTIGWENGDHRFMQNLYSTYNDKEHFHSKALKTLFFETLNVKRQRDIVPESIGKQIKVPYLNGGLFDKDISYAHDIDFPASLFHQLLDFFEQYNFTIDENDPYENEVGIDPEMLGHIFENLLEENREKGAFYTPKEIVHYMCRESLIEYLHTHLTDDNRNNIESLVRRNKVEEVFTDRKKAIEIDSLLKSVKICDPAIGSGAFPMGLLKEIFECRRLLYPYLKTNEPFNPALIKKEIIQNNIYGVDIEPGAVDIARLRFWLALVVDEIEPQPLPNLDYKIMQGNSLLERFGEVDLSQLTQEEDIIFAEKGQLELGAEFSATKQTVLFFDKIDQDELQSLINSYFDFEESVISQKYHSKKELKDKIDRIVEGKLIAKFRIDKDKSEKKISEIRLNIKGNEISPNDTKGLIDKKQKNIIKLNKELANAEEIYKKIYENLSKLKNLEENAQEKPYFLWHIWFKDVFDKGGFDIVIGNPPYLRIQGIREIDPEFADSLAVLYDSATGSFDLYVIFVEKALSIIKQKGIVNFIMPIKWTNAAFGKGLRTIAAEQQYASRIISFVAYQVFNASTYTGLQWFKKGCSHLKYNELNKDLPSNKELELYLGDLKDEDFELIPAEKLSDQPWTLTVGKTSEILSMLEKYPRKLENIFGKIFQGIATSKDNVYFIHNCAEKNNIIHGYSYQLNEEVFIEKEFLKPLLKGDSVHKYDNLSTNIMVLFPYKVIEEKVFLYTEDEIKMLFPLGHKYLKLCEIFLREREKGRFNIDDEWFQFGRKQGILFAEHEKIVAPDISYGGNFAYDKTGKFYQTTTVYGYIKNKNIQESYNFFLSILNSKLMWWYLTNTGTMLANGFFRFKPDYVKSFPIPEINLSLIKPFEILTDYLTYLKDMQNVQVNPYADNKNIFPVFEELLNMMVYELYFEQHMKDLEIDILQFIDTENMFKEIHSISDNKLKADIIGNTYKWLQGRENPIRNRIILSNIRSTDIIRVINSSI